MSKQDVIDRALQTDDGIEAIASAATACLSDATAREQRRKAMVAMLQAQRFLRRTMVKMEA